MEEATPTSRKPNPTERRLITRDWFKYYNALLVAGVYHFPGEEQGNDLSQAEIYFPALKRCIDTHPMLTAVVENATSSTERYTQVQTMNLYDHVNILQKLQSPAHNTEDDQIARLIEHIHNDVGLAIFNRPKSSPPWRIDVLPLDPAHNRVFISFTYSHCIGDGMSGPNFHKTFLAALNEKNAAVDAHLNIQKAALLGLPHLPVSLSFLIGPALGHYLPKFISSFFGLKASASGSDDGTWAGASHFDDRLSPDRPINTAAEIFILDGETLSRVLEVSRGHQTKLTGLLNELIALCLSRRLPNYSTSFAQKTNLISCTPTNIRRVAGIPSDAIGNIAGATYSRHSITRTQKLAIDDELWLRAHTRGIEVAKTVLSLKDQVTGLLGWVSNMQTWMGDQLGHTGDSSWQTSNLMAFDGGSESVTVERMYFSQPADVTGQPLQFNTVSVTGGDLVICVVWQPGVLGLDRTGETTVEETERKLVVEILQDLKACLMLAATG